MKIKRPSLGIIIALLLFNCSGDLDQTAKPQEIDTSIPSILHGAELNGRMLPDGTLTKITNGGAKVEFTFPDGIRFISVNQDGTYLVELGSCYECTGSCTSGCDVLYVRKKFACNQCDNGASCTGNSVPCSQEFQIDEPRSGYINLNAGISFVTRNADLGEYLKGPSLEILMQIPEVLGAMKEFNKKVYGTEMPDFRKLNEPVKPYVMNLFGTLAVCKIPDSYFANARTAVSELVVVPPGDATCSCTSGKTGCTYDSGIGWEMCESGACTKCRMNVPE